MLLTVRFLEVAKFTIVTSLSLLRLNSGNACYHSVQNLLFSHLPSKDV
jgi:hypothetical protein